MEKRIQCIANAFDIGFCMFFFFQESDQRKKVTFFMKVRYSE